MNILQPNLGSYSHFMALAAIIWLLQSHIGSCSYILALGVICLSLPITELQKLDPKAYSWLLGQLCCSQKNIKFGVKLLRNCQAAPSTAKAARNFSGACPSVILLLAVTRSLAPTI